MEDELSLDNILTSADIDSLFTAPDDDSSNTEDTDNLSEEKDKQTTEVNTDTLFDRPEGVGSDEEKEEKKDTDFSKGSSSPNTFSSIAKAFAEEGIFPNLEEEEINKVTNAQEFRELIDKHILSELDERQRRVDEALGIGVEPDVIRQYETTINYLNSISVDALEDESELGEDLRKRLIFLDYINRGYSKERANREVQKSLKGGTDLDDAKEALLGNKDFFKDKYDTLIKEAREEQQRQEDNRKKEAEKLRKSILEDSKVFGEIELDKKTRQKVLDSIAKPIYKDPETGEYLTAILKYEMENRTDFLKNLGLIFTLTDGFKNLDGLVKSKVRKEVKKGFKELENTLNNTARTSDGNLKFTSGSDPESIFRGWNLDV